MIRPMKSPISSYLISTKRTLKQVFRPHVKIITNRLPLAHLIWTKAGPIFQQWWTKKKLEHDFPCDDLELTVTSMKYIIFAILRSYLIIIIRSLRWRKLYLYQYETQNFQFFYDIFSMNSFTRFPDLLANLVVQKKT